MDNKKDNNYYARKAIEDIVCIQKYIGHKTYEEFISDGELMDAIMFRLIQLVESINNLSNEYKAENPQVPWGKIKGFRNGLVHEYGETDYSIVYEIITNDIEPLRVLFEKL